MIALDRESILGLDNIRLDLPVAGVGSRTLAGLIDYAVLGTAIVAWLLFCGFVGWLDAGWGLLLAVVGIFLFEYGYFAGLEIATGGRTLGKMAVGLRVVTAEGASPGAEPLLIRNLVRTFDLIAGIPLMALDPLARRLGDRLAGTLVVHGRRRAEATILGRVPPGWGAREVAVAEAFLAREGGLGDRAGAAAMARRLLERIEHDAPAFLDQTDRRDPIAALRQALRAGAPGAPPAPDMAGRMDYARFLRLHQPVWDAFDRQLAELRGDRGVRHGELDEMALRYRQVLHDHALAADRYPGTAVAARLETLALEGTRRLTRGAPAEEGGLRRFFASTFPAACRRHLPYLDVNVALFVGATAFGLVLAMLQPALGVAFLGPQAIDGLAEGHLWTDSLVSSVPPAFSSSRIATNNITVALTAWAGGVLAGVVPLWIVLLNGFMLGAIVSVTMHYSMAGELLAFVSAHGPLEITLILVSSSAGLAIGSALVTAGDRPRGVALQEAARDALWVLLGCAPWFVVLALVEVFVSPSPELPPVWKVGLGLALEALFLTLALRRPALERPR